MIRTIKIGDVEIGDKSKLTLIGGPCAIESKKHSLLMAGKIKEITDKLDIQLIFKSSYNKDCRSSIKSFHGIGLNEGLEILSEVKQEYGIPLTADVSNIEWMERTGEVVDLIQIPAYMSRQTHLIVGAAKTGKAVNIKKGQFLSPEEMILACLKLSTNGCENILLTDRGTFFGYNNLVNDMRCFKIMKGSGYPVCYDVTHSIQLPGAERIYSGGKREFIPYLTRAAISAGANALFMEIHDNPRVALCDSQSQLPLNKLEPILAQAKQVYELIQSFNDIEVN